jgi:hypothetical protein
MYTRYPDTIFTMAYRNHSSAKLHAPSLSPSSLYPSFKNAVEAENWACQRLPVESTNEMRAILAVHRNSLIQEFTGHGDSFDDVPSGH